MNQSEVKPQMLVVLLDTPEAKVYRLRRWLPMDGMVELEHFSGGWHSAGTAHVSGLLKPSSEQLKTHFRTRFAGAFT